MEDPSEKTSDTATDTTKLYDLIRLVLIDEKLNSKEKKNLIDELRKNNSATSDRWTFRWAIYFLGGTVVITTLFIAILAYHNCPIPDSLVAIGSTVAGGLAAMIAPYSARGK